MTSLELGKRKHEAEKYYALENSFKEKHLFKAIRRYYRHKPDVLESVASIASQPSLLRTLDAIVTRHVAGNLCYFLPKTDIPFNMAASYEQQLKHFQKRYFDIFRRRTKLELDGFETSYCQLNFFKWLDTYQLLPRLLACSPIVGDQKTKTKQKKKNKAIKEQLVAYVGPLTVPAIRGPPQPRFKLLLKPEKEYALLQRAICYYRIQPLRDLGRIGGWTKLLPHVVK